MPPKKQKNLKPRAGQEAKFKEGEGVKQNSLEGKERWRRAQGGKKRGATG